MRNDIIDAHMRKLSPEARGLAEEIDSRQDNAPDGTSPEELYGDLIPRMETLSDRDREALSGLFAAKASAYGAQAEQSRTEKAVFERIREIVQRAQRLSGRESLTVNEAVGWLREEGQLTEEEERFAASVVGRTVEVPDTRGL